MVSCSVIVAAPVGVEPRSRAVFMTFAPVNPAAHQASFEPPRPRIERGYLNLPRSGYKNRTFPKPPRFQSGLGPSFAAGCIDEDAIISKRCCSPSRPFSARRRRLGLLWRSLARSGLDVPDARGSMFQVNGILGRIRWRRVVSKLAMGAIWRSPWLVRGWGRSA